VITDPSAVTFTTSWTNHKDEGWWGSDGLAWHAYMDVRNTYTPILGDVTNEVVGWKLDGIDKCVRFEGGERTGIWPVGTIPNGASFAGFFDPSATFTNTYTNLTVNGTLLPSTD
jgi:hypothetical protein